ncbi:MAG: DUF3106 domain-containing protein [Burkholderiales bacterium]|nr:DUF3106 domain-containing protein [Burkholderiales bacterium]
MTSRPARLASLLALLLMLALAQTAVRAESGPAWASLNKAQQSALAPLQRDWATIDSVQKQKWLEVAGRFPRMVPAERQRVQGRMAEWAHMTPAERTRARLQFQESRELTASERKAKWQAYQALSAEQRQQLAQRAHPAAHGGGAASGSTHGRAEPARRPGVERPTQMRPVSPIVVQAAPGATTTTLTPHPPALHRHAPGPARIVATPGQVDPDTLLPMRRRPAPLPSAPGSAPASAPARP